MVADPPPSVDTNHEHLGVVAIPQRSVPLQAKAKYKLRPRPLPSGAKYIMEAPIAAASKDYLYISESYRAFLTDPPCTLSRNGLP
jgi:hypothetical protein